MSRAAAAMAAVGAHRLPSLVHVRVLPPKDARAGALDKMTWLTPYEAETIGEDARRGGPGTRLDIIVPRPISDDRLEAVRAIFAWLVPKGIEVSVRADDDGR